MADQDSSPPPPRKHESLSSSTSPPSPKAQRLTPSGSGEPLTIFNPLPPPSAAASTDSVSSSTSQSPREPPGPFQPSLPNVGHQRTTVQQQQPPPSPPAAAASTDSVSSSTSQSPQEPPGPSQPSIPIMGHQRTTVQQQQPPPPPPAAASTNPVPSSASQPRQEPIFSPPPAPEPGIDILPLGPVLNQNPDQYGQQFQFLVEVREIEPVLTFRIGHTDGSEEFIGIDRLRVDHYLMEGQEVDPNQVNLNPDPEGSSESDQVVPSISNPTARGNVGPSSPTVPNLQFPPHAGPPLNLNLDIDGLLETINRGRGQQEPSILHQTVNRNVGHSGVSNVQVTEQQTENRNVGHSGVSNFQATEQEGPSISVLEQGGSLILNQNQTNNENENVNVSHSSEPQNVHDEED